MCSCFEQREDRLSGRSRLRSFRDKRMYEIMIMVVAVALSPTSDAEVLWRPPSINKGSHRHLQTTSVAPTPALPTVSNTSSPTRLESVVPTTSFSPSVIPSARQRPGKESKSTKGLGSLKKDYSKQGKGKGGKGYSKRSAKLEKSKAPYDCYSDGKGKGKGSKSSSKGTKGSKRLKGSDGCSISTKVPIMPSISPAPSASSSPQVPTPTVASATQTPTLTIAPTVSELPTTQSSSSFSPTAGSPTGSATVVPSVAAPTTSTAIPTERAVETTSPSATGTVSPTPIDALDTVRPTGDSIDTTSPIALPTAASTTQPAASPVTEPTAAPFAAGESPTPTSAPVVGDIPTAAPSAGNTVQPTAVGSPPTSESTPSLSPVATTSEPSLGIVPTTPVAQPSAGETPSLGPTLTNEPSLAVPSVTLEPSSGGASPTVTGTTEPTNEVRPTILPSQTANPARETTAEPSLSLGAVPTVSPIAGSETTVPGEPTFVPTILPVTGTPAVDIPTAPPEPTLIGEPSITTGPTVIAPSATTDPTLVDSPTLTPAISEPSATISPTLTDVPTSSPVVEEPSATMGPSLAGVPNLTPTVGEPSALTPSELPLDEPTQVPTALSPVVDSPTLVSSPTSAETSEPSAVAPTVSEAREPAPFSITYEGVEGDLPDAAISNAANLTMGHLEDWLRLSLGFEGAEIESFVWNTVDNSTDPATLGYDVNVTFAAGSSFVPSQELLDSFINRAFAPENVETLLLELQQLPTSDPFSQVTDATFSSNPDDTPNGGLESTEGMRFFGGFVTAKTGMGFAAGMGLAAFLLGTVLLRQRRREARVRSRTSKLLSPEWLEATQVSGSDTASDADSFFNDSVRLMQTISSWTAEHDSFDDMEIEFHSLQRRRTDHLDDPLFQAPFTTSLVQ